MVFRRFQIPRPLFMAISGLGLVSLAIGAHAAFNKRALEAARAAVTDYANANQSHARVALVIGNGNYPDAGVPLAQPINDARAVTAALRHDGFDVDVVEDATREDMARAVERLKARIRPDSGTSCRRASTTPPKHMIGADTISVNVSSTSICTCCTSLVVRVISDGAPKVPTSRAENDPTRWKRSRRTSRPKAAAVRAPK